MRKLFPNRCVFIINLASGRFYFMFFLFSIISCKTKLYSEELIFESQFQISPNKEVTF